MLASVHMFEVTFSGNVEDVSTNKMTFIARLKRVFHNECLLRMLVLKYDVKLNLRISRQYDISDIFYGRILFHKAVTPAGLVSKN